LKAIWWRLVAFGFRLLYNEMAWTYDAVSWVVSLGNWRAWQRTALPFLPQDSKVLEVGSGPGHLLLDLSRAGHQPVGMDLSPAMLGQSRRRLRRKGSQVRLCRGMTNALPFGPNCFDAIVSTFPTAYIYDQDWIAGAKRILKPGVRLVVVEFASLRKGDPISRSVEWLYHITGQRASPRDLAVQLEAAGLVARREVVQVDGTRAVLVVAGTE
jgi:ubiquinone/menaquinone biosynthesis C-methylase UbiE